MIIEFSLGNYRSFNEVQTLNFRATGLTSEDKTIDENNIAVVGGQRLLKTIGIYGANASGKSNLIRGLYFFQQMVKSSLSNEYLLLENQLFEPLRLGEFEKFENIGFFQMVLYIDGSRYRYGFTLGSDEIESEWLFGPAKSNETYYFTRNENQIEINSAHFQEGLDIPYDTKLRKNTLFLSFCSSYNGNISGIIRHFIANCINIDKGYLIDNTETNKLIRNNQKELVLSWLRQASLNYNDIEINNLPLSSLRNEMEYASIKMHKNVYSSNGNVIGLMVMDLERDESQGTQKYYSFIGRLYNTFENGGLFISDEIDSNFHPALLIKIIGMFNNPAINKANAQLLFTSHDTNLMNPEIMRRDQFYFTEKSATDATVLYSLADLKGIRNNADFAKQYLAGYYGALPMLNTFTEPENNH